MTKKQIVKYCLEEYEKLLKDTKDQSFYNMKKISDERDMLSGVCFFMARSRKVDIYGKKWVSKHCGDSSVWGPYPKWAQSKEEFIERIQTRIDILKLELFVLKSCTKRENF